MKTLSVFALLGIAVVAVAINLQASDLAISPRAKANRIVSVSSVQTGSVAISKHCAAGSPKQLDQAAKNASATCCQVATTCTAPKSCCSMASK